MPAVISTWMHSQRHLVDSQFHHGSSTHPTASRTQHTELIPDNPAATAALPLQWTHHWSGQISIKAKKMAAISQIRKWRLWRAHRGSVHQSESDHEKGFSMLVSSMQEKTSQNRFRKIRTSKGGESSIWAAWFLVQRKKTWCHQYLERKKFPASTLTCICFLRC